MVSDCWNQHQSPGDLSSKWGLTAVAMAHQSPLFRTPICSGITGHVQKGKWASSTAPRKRSVSNLRTGLIPFPWPIYFLNQGWPYVAILANKNSARGLLERFLHSEKGAQEKYVLPSGLSMLLYDTVMFGSTAAMLWPRGDKPENKHLSLRMAGEKDGKNPHLRWCH